MIYLRTFLLFLVALLLLTAGDRAYGQSPNATTVMKNMADRYAALSSYQDIGVVEITSEGELPRRGTNTLFKSYFTRPNKLRFEWLTSAFFSSAERSVIWSDGTEAFTFRGYEPGIEKEDDLVSAIAGATGVSLGSAHTVPELLLNSELMGFSLTDLARLSLKNEEVFEGELCYVLSGFKEEEEWRMWISKKDLLLRKLKRPSTNGEFEEEIHRNIKVDEKIVDTIFHPKVSGGRVVNVLDKDKEVDIQKLLSLIAPPDRLNQEVANVIALLKAVMTKVPEKTWQEVISELGLDGNMFARIYVPLYDWHYSADEIKELIRFYESPLGQKLSRNMVLIELEAKGRATKLGQDLVERVQEKLRAKGYKSTA